MQQKQASLKNWIPNGSKRPADTSGGQRQLADVTNDWQQRTSSGLNVIDLHPGVKKRRVLPASVTTAPSKVTPPKYNAQAYAPMRRQSTEEDDSVKVEVPDIDPMTVYSLSKSQKRALDAIMQRQSVFFTGAAGTGKSHILKVLQDVLGALKLSSKICFTAPTGVAACNIRGLTLHSWAGIGQGTDDTEALIGQVMRSRQASQRWRETDILVIDEISMLSAELFDKLDIIGRRVRNTLQVFGGLQLVLCGDFFQLPPVGLGRNASFTFDAAAWHELFDDHPEHMINLETVYRQKDDLTLLNILNDLRVGQVSQQSNRVLQSKVQESSLAKHLPMPSVRPTKLFSTNKDVDGYNLTELQHLADQHDSDEASEPRFYQSVDEGKEPYMNQLRSGTKAPQALTLRIGAQVMLLKNLSASEGLVNGARGSVIGFEKANGRSAFYPHLPVVKFQVFVGSEKREEVRTITHDSWDIKQGDRVLASRIQIPLILAWAISIHKSQGMTIPLLEVSFHKMFEYGQGYVALSRATCLQGLTLQSFAAQAVRAHPKVKVFYEELSARCRSNEDDSAVTVTVADFMALFNGEAATATVDKRAAVDHEKWIDTRKPIAGNGNQGNRTVTAGSGRAMQAFDIWLEERPPVSPSKAYTQQPLVRRPTVSSSSSSGYPPLPPSSSSSGYCAPSSAAMVPVPVIAPSTGFVTASSMANGNSLPRAAPPVRSTPPVHIPALPPAPFPAASAAIPAANAFAAAPVPKAAIPVASAYSASNAAHSSTKASSSAGTSTGAGTATGGISDTLKKKIEENRQQALQKLEQFK